MKTLDNTKAIVLAVGTLVILVSLVGAVKDMSLVDYFFPLYTGFTLAGTAILHKEDKTVIERGSH
jgi:hypothetical protein